MKEALPNGIAENGERWTAGHILLPRKFASDQRSDPEHVKKVRTDALLLDVFNATGSEQIDSAITAVDGAIEERGVIARELPNFAGLPSFSARCAIVLVHVGDHDEAAGIGVRQGTEEDRIYDAIDCGVCT